MRDQGTCFFFFLNSFQANWSSNSGLFKFGVIPIPKNLLGRAFQMGFIWTSHSLHAKPELSSQKHPGRPSRNCVTTSLACCLKFRNL